MITKGNNEEKYSRMKLRITEVFSPFRQYGLDVYVPGAVSSVMAIVRQLDREYEKEKEKDKV